MIIRRKKNELKEVKRLCIFPKSFYNKTDGSTETYWFEKIIIIKRYDITRNKWVFYDLKVGW